MAPPSSHPRPQIPGQELSSKDLANFRSLIKLYDKKSYKKAVKVADQIIKKNPLHGETASMKGIICWYIPERRHEAMEWTKKGLRLNLSSSTCWHVLGLLHRNLREFNEAMKCFNQACRLDPENVSLLRDLMTLQIHEGNTVGFLESRKRLFFTMPGVKTNWICYAFSQHLVGNFVLASRLLRTTLSHFKRISGGHGAAVDDAWENSELHLYEVMLLEEGESLKEAVLRLRECPSVADKEGRLTVLGRLLIYLQHYDEAHEVYMQLFKYQRANHLPLLCALATHQSFRNFVKFPSPPKMKTTSDFSYPEIFTKSTDTDLNMKFLSLSLYALGGPRLNGSLADGWLRHPQHIVFPEAPVRQKEETLSPIELQFYLLRNLTEKEEQSVSEWFLSKVFVNNTKSINDTAIRLLLNLVSNENRFLFYLDKLLRDKILKGGPFCINMIKVVCRDPIKGVLIEKLLTMYLSHINDQSSTSLGSITLPIEISKESCSECSDLESSSLRSTSVRAATKVVCLAALSALYHYRNDNEKALLTIDQAIELTPTFPELFLIRSQILKHSGDFKEAAASICEGRELDLADRFLNTKAVKYTFANDDIQNATQMALYFSLEDNLKEMQSMWIEVCKGSAYRRLSQLGPALKQFYSVVKHFSDIKADLYDFHAYCQRRGSFRSYLPTLRMRNRIYAHRYYRLAVKNIIEILLSQSEVDQAANDVTASTTIPSVPTSPDPTKNKRKKKKTESPASITPPHINPSLQKKEIDEDPDGLKLLLVGEDAVEECQRLITGLSLTAQLSTTTHQLAYSVACAKKNKVIMLQSVYRLWKLTGTNPLHPSLFPYLYDFLTNHMSSDDNVTEFNKVLALVCENVMKEILSESILPYLQMNDLLDQQNWNEIGSQLLSFVLGEMVGQPKIETIIAVIRSLSSTPILFNKHSDEIKKAISFQTKSQLSIKAASELYDVAKGTEIFVCVKVL